METLPLPVLSPAPYGTANASSASFHQQQFVASPLGTSAPSMPGAAWPTSMDTPMSASAPTRATSFLLTSHPSGQPSTAAFQHPSVAAAGMLPAPAPVAAPLAAAPVAATGTAALPPAVPAAAATAALGGPVAFGSVAPATATASAPSAPSSPFPMLDDMDSQQPGRSRSRLGSSASASGSGATFFDTMQAVGLSAFPTFRKSGAGGDDGTTFDGPVWEVMPEPADPLSPFVFDDVHAFADGFDPTGVDMPYLRSRLRGAASDMEDEEMDSVMSARAAANPALDLDADDEMDEDDELGMAGRLEHDKSEIHAALNAAAAAAAAAAERTGSSPSSVASAVSLKSTKSRRSTSSSSKRDRAVAPGRTPFVAGQHMNPTRFFIDVELTVLPHTALTWLLEKVEAQEHSAKTCRYYLSRSPVCSACRDVFKAGRKLFENNGSVKCLYRALRLQACMDVGMRFDAVGGGASLANHDSKKRKKLKRQQRGAGKRQCSVGARMHHLLKILVRTSANQQAAQRSVAVAAPAAVPIKTLQS